MRSGRHGRMGAAKLVGSWTDFRIEPRQEPQPLSKYSAFDCSAQTHGALEIRRGAAVHLPEGGREVAVAGKPEVQA